MGNFRKRGEEAVLICVCMVVITIMPATAPSMPTISVEPSHLKVSQNETFTINITVNPAGYEIYAAQYYLYFNPIILKVISQSQGNFLSQDGANTIVLVNNNTNGRVEYAEFRTSVENGVTTPGTLASITFKAIKCGKSELKLSNVILSDINATSIMTNVSSGNVIVEPTVFGAMFDTGRGEYPSIAGTHNGTITPKHDIIVNCIYTYPCEGTGGHTEHVIIYNGTEIIAEARWNGYIDDYYNITFPNTFTLLANHTYNYTIITCLLYTSPSPRDRG